MTAVRLPGSDHLQVFVGGVTNAAVTLTQTGIAPLSETQPLGSTWSSASPFPMSAQTGATDYTCVASCQDESGKANLWAMPNLGNTLETRAKSSASASWSQPAAFNPQPSSSDGVIRAITAGKSVPGRIQLFAALPDKAAGSSALITTWETEENSGNYNDWEPMEGAPPLALIGPCLTCHNLPDGRLQLWAVAAEGDLMSCWKSGSERGAPWTSWVVVTVGARFVSMAGGVDADGYVELWACSSGGTIVNAIQASSPSDQVNWTDSVYAANPGPLTPYALAAAKLTSGNLQVFVTGRMPNTNADTGLYAQGVAENGGYGWKLLSSLGN